LLATVLLLTTPFFFRIGTTALIDMPATFFFVLSLFLTLHLLQAPTAWLAVTTGFCVGAGLLCRYTVVLLYPVLLGTLLVSDAWRHRVLYLAVVVLVSVIIVTPWVVYATHSGILATQGETLFLYGSYVATTGKRWLLKVLLFRLPSGVGVANLPMLLLGGGQLLQRRNWSDLFVMLWIAAIFFPLMATLPAPRYFLPAFPALAIVMAHGVLRSGEVAERLVILALLYAGGAWYLFVDWFRAAGGLFRH
jgi:4-amino-4-deoxy-L-arabinose transferase-like glycosyltransferase